jgi:hypothetical protein
MCNDCNENIKIQNGSISVEKSNPEVLNIWNYEKNIKLGITPKNISRGSGLKVWWKCNICNKSWDALIGNIIRSNSNGCPYCKGLKVCLENCLATLYPEIAEEWHPTENKELTPYDVTPGTGIKIYWLCPKCKSSYDMLCGNRAYCNQNCPYCVGKRVNETNSLSSIYPDVAKEWDYENNKINPENVYCTSSKYANWKCSKCNKTWRASICNRTRQQTGCPYCTGQKVCLENCLATINPELAKQWHPTRNDGLTPYNFTVNSNKKVWWYCDVCHMDYDTTIANKNTNKYGCPYCTGQRVCEWNCLATVFPNIAKAWHPTLNGDLTSKDITSKANRVVWWICDICHKDFCGKICTRSLYNIDIVKCSKCYSFYQEEMVRTIFENLTGKKFIKTKNIPWLKNKLNNRPLEADGYCEELNIIFEHQGEQHVNLCSEKYHPNGMESFFYRLFLDAEKYKLCKKNNCNLICTYYNQTQKEIEQYIKEKLIELGVTIINE